VANLGACDHRVTYAIIYLSEEGLSGFCMIIS